MAESEEELKSLLVKVKVESEKVGLKLNIQKMTIMASGPINSCQIDEETVMSITLVMPSNHLILCCPLLLLPSIFPSIRFFSNESTLHMRWPKYWNFSFSIIRSKEHPGLISFRMDPYMTTGKTIALTRRTFVCKVMSLLFNMLSRLVVTFLTRSK